jgi:hypothetical protein
VTASAPATVGAERESVLGTVLAFLALHVLCWTVFATVTHGAVHHDMAEAWAWGKEPALGYYKHPPVSAWIAYAWFGVFPRTSFFFYLLAETNAALGLLGAWMIAARVLAAPERAASLAMLCLTPLYNLYALKYNANTVLLSLWPWTAYAAIRAVETRRIVWGVAFGVMAALSMLAKYYSGLLLVSCLAAALLHPNARAFFRSPAPYVAVLVGAALISPHVHWMATNGFQTLEYAAATTRHKFSANLLRGLSAPVQAFAFHAIPVAALLWALEPKQRAGFARRLVGGAWDRRNWWIVALAFGPFVLTILALLVGNVRISAQFMIPIFFMVPVALLAVSAVPLPWASIRARAGTAVPADRRSGLAADRDSAVPHARADLPGAARRRGGGRDEGLARGFRHTARHRRRRGALCARRDVLQPRCALRIHRLRLQAGGGDNAGAAEAQRHAGDLRDDRQGLRGAREAVSVGGRAPCRLRHRADAVVARRQAANVRLLPGAAEALNPHP